MSEDFNPNDLRPRLCHLRRWPNFTGYGFNLHSDKSRSGQYIGKVDANSPAQSAGLRENDRIIEINFVPIGTESHPQVVQRIREGVLRNGTKYPEEVILLVVDPQTDEKYKLQSKLPKSIDPDVIKFETALSPQVVETNEMDDDANGSTSRSESSRSDSPGLTPTQLRSAPKQFNRKSEPAVNVERYEVVKTTRPDLVTTRPADDPVYGRPDNYEDEEDTKHMPTTKDKRYSVPASSYRNGTGGVVEPQMSLAAYREQLRREGTNRRNMRQNTTMTMQERYNMINDL